MGGYKRQELRALGAGLASDEKGRGDETKV